MSSRPSLRSSAITSGTSVLCPPASDDTPTTCTSLSTAKRATSRGSLEERADVHVEAHIGEGGGNHLGAAIVPVLAHLGHQNARPPAFGLFELYRHLRVPF